ncbi:MAG: Eco57I restriction-modification methylase domain-containing protein [Acidimicrobiales bacterium]
MASPSSRQGRRPLANPKAAIDDWLNLIDPDGAFLTVTELTAAFPHGFEPMPAEQRTELRSRVADLDDDPAPRSELRCWLLATVLDWDDLLAEDQRLPATSLVRVAEQGVSIRPGQALLDVDNPNKIRVGVFLWPLGTQLERRTDITTAGDTWPASPVQRAETWCRESGVPLALVTDDDQWTLVWAPRGAPAASCRWRLSDLADERILQAGFVSLLGARRFFAVGDDETLEKLFERAANAEAEITKGLGSSVRRSVELLVAAISRDDVANDHRVLAGVAPTEVYESAVTVLMRLVFLLFAEERRLLPAEDPLWAESYSVLTLRDDLRAASIRDGEDALERRSTAWYRLLATCRAVHGGANHDRLTLPAYGGSLFDPERFPFLEGRRAPDHIVAGGIDLGPAEDAATGPGRPVAIDDRTVLAILDALLNIKVRSGRSTVTQRVSYKALDVEQIGHCYEGLLDHSSVRIDVLSVGLTGPEGAEPEIAIGDLEHHLAGGIDGLCEWLADKERCNKTASALAKELEKRPEGVDLARLRVACGHNDDRVTRVQPFWGLIRTDLRGLPVVLLPGSQFVTQTSTRRNMGAQYTTKALAEEVAQYALEPLVYEPGPQSEADPEKWQLRPPSAILGLRICDPAVGSGAILTAAGRYLADRLIESVVEHGPGEGPFATRLSDLADASPEEQVVLARREIVDHCLYGVDKNPVAAEMAKLSLWLTTMARERPFTFLDHAIQVGDSLLGITDLEQLRWLHLHPAERKGKAGFTTVALDLRLKEAADLARRLQDLSVVSVRDAKEKQRLHEELRAKLGDLSVVADTVVGAALSTAGHRGASIEQRLDAQMERIRNALDEDRPLVEQDAAIGVLRSISTGWLRTDLPDEVPTPWERHCLHWPLAFPEVFLNEGRSGFDGVVANPPFLGGTRISGATGKSYQSYLGQYIAGRSTDRADLVAFFFLRASTIAHDLGMLATNTLSQGDTRDVGLSVLLEQRWTIYRAVKSEPWPNDASLDIAKVWLSDRSWQGNRYLGGQRVSLISASLDTSNRSAHPPMQLAANSGLYSEGVKPLGQGFLVTPDEASALIGSNSKNLDVLRPYLNGKDLNDDPLQSPSRWIINFFDWPEARAKTYAECFEIAERLVKPERTRRKANGEFQLRRPLPERWWQYAEKRTALYVALSSAPRALALVRHAPYPIPQWVDPSVVFSEALAVFVLESDEDFGVLNSSVHYVWAVEHSSTLGGEANIRYTASDVFATFPRPEAVDKKTARIAELLHGHRCELMASSGLGLTKTYNRVHDPEDNNPDVVQLRGYHVELDLAVRDAYGWSNLDLGHHHWETPQGMRFTVSPEAKDGLLDRLLELNHERYAAEVAAGLHNKKMKKAPVTRKALAPDPAQETLL